MAVDLKGRRRAKRRKAKRDSLRRTKVLARRERNRNRKPRGHLTSSEKYQLRNQPGMTIEQAREKKPLFLRSGRPNR